MPRRPRYAPIGLPQHIIQRGHNREVCFASTEDMQVYMQLLAKYATRHATLIHAWVLMTNHTHLLVTPTAENGLQKMMRDHGRGFARYFNDKYRRSGSLFEGRYKNHPVQTERYFLYCQRYIELNPVRANMVTDPSEYRWSSYRCHGLGLVSKIWTPHRIYLGLHEDLHERLGFYRKLIATAIPSSVIEQIEECSNTGFVLGSSAFKRKVEKLAGRPQRRLPPGPKRK